MIDRDLNLKELPDVLRMKGQDKGFPLSGIWVYSGSQGSGKTLNMIHTLIEIHEKFPKCKIVSNINLFGIPYEIYHDFNDFDRYANGHDGVCFVIDEIQTLFSSLESKNVPLSQLEVWSQNRKNRRVILGTSQRFTRISKPIREQCKFHIECRNIAFLRLYRVLDATLYNDDGDYTGKKPYYKPYIPTIKSFLSYNTYEVVERDPEVKR